MPTGIESLPTAAQQVRAKDWLIAPLLLLASGVLLLLAYLQYNWPGNWISSPEPMSWNGEALKLTKGQGFGRDSSLTIESLAEQGVAIASLTPKTFSAKDYPLVSWRIREVQPGTQVFFLWRTTENPNRVFNRALVSSKGGVVPLEMVGDENWQGQVMGLALMVKGQLDAPLTIDGVSLKPVSARAALATTLARWFATEGWQATSINFLDGDAREQELPLLPAVAILILLALISYLVLAKFKFVQWNAAVFGCIVFLGWFALDARWQWNLFQQLAMTQHQFAGKSWEEKHLAAEDGALFEFMRQVKAKLPAGPTRVLYFSDDAYLRGKGAYYLYPHNVMTSGDAAGATQLKSGDYIVLLGKKGVRYDPATQMLAWDGIQPIRADLLMSAAGDLLLKVH